MARLIEMKGLHILLEACAHLRDRGIAFRCEIVGEGSLYPELEATIARDHLHDRVRLLGIRTQHEVLERLQTVHLFVLPCVQAANGEHDRIPVAITEALACGRPVVTTPIGGISEVVRHDYNGLLVRPDNAYALSEALESMISDSELYARLRANTRASVDKRFNLNETAQQLARLFEGSSEYLRRAP